VQASRWGKSRDSRPLFVLTGLPRSLPAAIFPGAHEPRPASGRVALPRGRVLLVGAPRKGTRSAAEVEEPLGELARLADTAGAGVVGRVVQIVAAPAPPMPISPVCLTR
jgi:hypothetical protein